MDLKLAGRTALVTGASQGIGRAIAKGLAAEGAQVAIVARRAPLLEQLADEIAATGALRPVIIAADVMPEGAPQQLAQSAIEALKHVDVLVNSAGGSRIIPLDAAEDHWVEAITLNWTRVRQLVHALLPHMQERKYGRIVNITGKSEAETPTPGKINVAMAAKAGLHMWAKHLSREIARDGITINCIGPGKIMSEQIRKKYTPEERERIAKQEIPAGYFGEPEDLAVLAVFLASPLAHYITGTVTAVDGSYRRYPY